MLAQPVCSFKGAECEPAPACPQVVENFPVAAASGGLDPELAGRVDRLLQNGASITSAGKREMLGWRQILLKNCEHRALL